MRARSLTPPAKSASRAAAAPYMSFVPTFNDELSARLRQVIGKEQREGKCSEKRPEQEGTAFLGTPATRLQAPRMRAHAPPSAETDAVVSVGSQSQAPRATGEVRIAQRPPWALRHVACSYFRSLPVSPLPLPHPFFVTWCLYRLRAGFGEQGRVGWSSCRQ